MKKLIFSAFACLFLMTSCFESEEKEEVTPTPPIEEVDILECDDVKRFLEFTQSEPPRTPRASVEKYKKGSQIIFAINTGGDPAEDIVGKIYRQENCEGICQETNGVAGSDCPIGFYDDLVFIETIWQDER